MVYSGDSIQDTDGGVLRPISSVHRNRIINGDCRIDQRNAGASVTPTIGGYFSLDRWRTALSVTSKFSLQQNAGAVTPPTGFTNYLGATSLSAYSITSSDFFTILQIIEGYNVADLGWGTANAKTVTLSFWVRSSLTGTFGGALRNSADDRSYPFSYTISAANTWEQKSVTIAGDTSGTWLTTNGSGIKVIFGLGVGATTSGTAGAWAGAGYNSATGATSVIGTNGATFYITGVQLEVGTQATSFEYRQYGTELNLCQRYYYKAIGDSASEIGVGYNNTTTIQRSLIYFPVPLRISPTSLETSGTAANYSVIHGNTNTAATAVPAFSTANQYVARVNTTTSGLTAGQGSFLRFDNTSAYLAFPAEL
jgi:hypothetical protein